ncbi:MAG: hypothetical protein ACRDLS_15690 [Solirubrobacteraceae bacterium]
MARSQVLVTAAALALAAGVIHAVAMIDHVDHYWLYGVFFLAVTYAQVLWAIRVYRRPPGRRVLVAGAVGSLLIVAVWLVTRTVGVPVGPEAGDPEPAGAMDIMATLDQLVLAALVATVVAPEGWLGSRLRWLAGGHAVRIAIMLCSASLFSLMLGSHSH